jgi:TonB family protein
VFGRVLPAGVLLLLALQVTPAAPRQYLVARNGAFAIVADDGLQKVFPLMRRSPEYPHEARRNHWSGAGLFRAEVTPSGSVANVKVLKSTGHRVMDEMVVTSVRTWQAAAGKKREVDFAIAFVAPARGMPSPGL